MRTITSPNLRGLLGGLLAGSLLSLAPIATAAPASAERLTHALAGVSRSAPVRFELPPPTGPYAIGTTELHLVDRGRADPWVAGRPRELMISVWYPARGSGSGTAPYLRPGAARVIDEAGALGLFRPGEVDWASARTHAETGAPADLRHGRRPVVLYSPGFGLPRALGTMLAEELAGRGYVVVTMDHTYESNPVEFPGGRVEVQALPAPGPERLKTAMDTRVRDTRFILDRLTYLSNGGNPDAEGRRLPPGIGRVLDVARVGMFGHSAGGIQAAETMRVDRRLDAGIDLDGTLQYEENDLMPVAREGLDRPFMLLGAGQADGTSQTHETSPSWRSFWERSTGWKRDLNVPEGRHYTFTDLQAILPMLDETLDVPAQDRMDFIGTVDPVRILASERAYVTAFFDRHLRKLRRPVLDGPSPRHPDVVFVGRAPLRTSGDQQLESQ